jgi:hypothetical protein
MTQATPANHEIPPLPPLQRGLRDREVIFCVIGDDSHIEIEKKFPPLRRERDRVGVKKGFFYTFGKEKYQIDFNNHSTKSKPYRFVSRS